MVIDDFSKYLANELRRSPLTVEAYTRDVTQFALWVTGGKIDNFKPSEIAVNDIRAWMASLSRGGDESRTIRRKAQSLRAFFRLLLKRKTIDTNPASEILLPKIPKRLPEVVKSDEVQHIIDGEDELLKSNSDNEQLMRDALIIDILYSLGIRRAEIVAISDSDITLSPPEIKIHGKRDKQRVVPMPQQLLSKIKSWQILRDSLWPDLPTPKPLLAVKGKRITPQQVYASVKRQLSSTSAGKKSPHALRHSFATAMLNGGAEINSVKEFLGHASLATTQIYTHVSFAEMQKAYSAAHPRAGRQDGEEKAR